DPAAQPKPVAVGGDVAPGALELAAPYPNPTRGPLARFEFALPRTGAVRLEILDVEGRRLRTLVAGTLAAGRYVRGWDLRDERGSAIAPGIFQARVGSRGGW